MAYVIKFKRGLEANKPSEMESGEIFLALDTKSLWVGQGRHLPLQKVISSVSDSSVTTVAGRVGDVVLTTADITTDSSNRFVSDAEKSTWSAKQAALGFTPANSVHNHVASDVTTDATNRFSTDAEKSLWNAKQDDLGFTPAHDVHSHVKADVTDFSHTHNKSDISDFSHGHLATEITQDETHRFTTDTEKSTWNAALSVVPDSITVDSILPKTDHVSSIGSPTQRFKEIYVDEAHLSVNTLYLGDTPVVGTEQATIVVKADLDQSIALKTSGLGQTNVFSQNGVQISTSGQNANVNLQTAGAGSEIHLTSTDEVNLNAPIITLAGATTVSSSLTVSGNLIVNGTTTTVNSSSLAVSDNIIEINKDQIGNGVTAGSAGLKVNRGDDPAYFIMFDETDDLFKVGMSGNLETIASRVYAIKNDGNVPSMSSGLDASKTSAGTIGRLYIAQDTKKLYRDNGTSWDMIGGTVSSVAGRTGDVVLTTADIATDVSNRFVSDAEKSTWNGKQAALGFTPENSANKNIANGYAGLDVDNKISALQIPSLSPSSITQDTSNRFVTDTEKSTWNGKQEAATTLSGYGITDATPSTHIGSTGSEHGVATTSVNGFMSSTDKVKLDSLSDNPTGDGNLHVPATGTTSNGMVLTAGATAGSISWQTPSVGSGSGGSGSVGIPIMFNTPNDNQSSCQVGFNASKTCTSIKALCASTNAVNVWLLRSAGGVITKIADMSVVGDQTFSISSVTFNAGDKVWAKINGNAQNIQQLTVELV